MKTLILAFALLTFINSNAQDIKKNIQDNIHEISINPEDTSYADLSYLAEAIKNVRVVMLGEQDHGDGTTFLAKTRIVKFLHEKLGYNVLAFESDFLSVNLAWSQVEEKKISVKEAINRNIYPVWTNCSQCDGLFKYIEAISGTPDPLKLTGFDNQLTGVTGYLNIKNILLDSIKHYDPAFLENQGVSFSLKIDTAVDLLGGKSQIKNINKKEFYKSFIKSLSVIEERVAKVTTADNSFLILIKSIKSFYTEIEHLINNEKLSSGQERDHQMAENLEWIIQTKYPKEKIIVWAANSHIIKNDQEEINKKFHVPFSMGQILTRKPEMSSQVYIIGFTGYSGTSKRAHGWERVIELSTPKKNSLESWIHETKTENAFIDFERLRNDMKYKNETFFMNFHGWLHAKSDWLNSYDGMIYIDKMSPCEVK